MKNDIIYDDIVRGYNDTAIGDYYGFKDYDGV